MVRIVAVTPPGSMERVISDLRGELYGRWGAVSALALPPLIPLAAWRRVVAAPQAAALLAGCARPARFELDQYRRDDGYLYLTVRSEALDEMARAITAVADDRASGPVVPPLFPLHPGFLLAGPDLVVGPREIERLLPIPAERSFRSYGLSIWGIETGAPAECWWDLVSWDEEVHVPVKTNGRAAPGSAARLRP